MKTSQTKKTRGVVARVAPTVVAKERGVSVRTVQRWRKAGNPLGDPLTADERKLFADMESLSAEIDSLTEPTAAVKGAK